MISGITLFLVFNIIVSASSENDPDAYLEEAGQIYSSILHKYNEKVRPPDSWPDQVSVGLSGTLWHIRDIDLMKQEMESLVELRISWRDKRLAWYPYKVNQISANVSTVWSPEIIYSNAALPPRPMLSPKVTITSGGYITWKRREIITTLCPTDPFNRIQSCSIDLQLVSPGNQEYFQNSTSFTLAEPFNNHRWGINTVELKFSDGNQTEINYIITVYKKAKISQSVLDHESNCSLALKYMNTAVPQINLTSSLLVCVLLVTVVNIFQYL